MLSQRVKAAAIFIPLVLGMIFLGGWAFNGFVTLVMLLAALEFSRVFKKLGAQPFTPLLLAGVLLFLLQRWFFPQAGLDLLLTGLIALSALTALIQYETGVKEATIGFAVDLAGTLYLGWVGGFFITLRNLPYGLGWTLTALPTIWLADCGAYFIGRWLGKKKMAPKLSPKKTWAGFGGGLLAGTLSGTLLVALWGAIGWLPPKTLLWQGALMGLVLAGLTPIGDLLISLFKRSASLKDTGNLIPGHGGVLDRIDTWLWAAMLGYYMVRMFRG